MQEQTDRRKYCSLFILFAGAPSCVLRVVVGLAKLSFAILFSFKSYFFINTGNRRKQKFQISLVVGVEPTKSNIKVTLLTEVSVLYATVYLIRGISDYGTLSSPMNEVTVVFATGNCGQKMPGIIETGFYAFAFKANVEVSVLCTTAILFFWGRWKGSNLQPRH